MKDTVKNPQATLETPAVAGTIIACALAAFLLFSCATPQDRIYDIESIVRDVSEKTVSEALTIAPISQGMSMFRMVTAKGSPRELGYFLGMTGKECGFAFPSVDEKKKPFNDSIIAFYEELYPAYLEELRGVADAYGKKLEDLDLTIMENRFFARMGIEGYGTQSCDSGFTGCAVVGCVGKDGTPMIGRNLDTANITGFLVRSEIEGCYKSINTSGEAFQDYAVDGLNEKGLFIGEMSITDPAYARANISPGYPDRPSVYSMHMMRMVLDTCATVDEAISLFGRVPVWFTYDLWHFFVADENGSFAVIELDTSGKLRVTRAEGASLLSTNTPLLEGRDSLMRCPRYAIADGYLKERGNSKTVTHEGMAELMKRMAIRKDNPDLEKILKPEQSAWLSRLRTVWTSTYDLKDKTLIIRYWEDGYAEHVMSF